MKGPLAVCFCLSFILLSARVHAQYVLPDNVHRYAVVIGISDYKFNYISPLKYAHLDAYRYYNFLQSGYAGTFKEIKFLPDTIASYANMLNAFYLWIQQLKKVFQEEKGGELYIFYSGHGVKYRGEQKLLTYDTEILDTNLSKLANDFSVKQIVDATDGLLDAERGGRIILITDACRKSEDRSVQDKYADFYMADKVDVNANVIQLISTTTGKYSYETSDLKLGGPLSLTNDKDGSGVFSCFLLLGLYGAADREPDNRITFGELRKFLQENVEAYTEKILHKSANELQLPVLHCPDEELVLSVVPPDVAKQYKSRYEAIRKQMDATGGKNMIKRQAAKGWSPGVHNSIAEESAAAPFPFPANISVNNSIVLTDTFAVGAYEAILYNNFTKAIKAERLIKPADSSAWAFYQSIQKYSRNTQLLNTSQSMLFTALADHSQQVINKYLRGMLEDLSTENFMNSYQELALTARMLDPQSTYANVIMPKQQFLRARALTSSKNPRDWEAAMAIIDSSLKVAPYAAYAHHTKALIYLKQNKFQSAIRSFETAADLAPHWAYPVYSLALSYYDQGRFDKSIYYCKKAIDIDPKYGLPYTLIALNYENAKMYDSAIAWNQKAIETDPATADAYYYLGRIYGQKIKERSLANAKISKDYFTWGAQKLGNADSYYELANKHKENYDYDSAQYFFNKILQMNPYYARAYEGWAYMMNNNSKSGRPGDSLMQAMLSIVGTDDAYTRDAYYKLQYKTEAAADSAYKQALALSTENPDTYLDYMEGWENRKHNYTKARSIMYDAMQHMKNNPLLDHKMGDFYFRHNRDSAFAGYALDSAVYYYKKAAARNPEYAFTYLGLYNTYLSKGNIDSSLKYLGIARALNRYIDSVNQFNPDLLRFADKYLMEKNYEKAIAYYSLANELLKPGFTIYQQMALCYYLKGSADTAWPLWTQAKELIRNGQDRVANKLLGAMILFDRQDYRRAEEMTASLIEEDDSPEYLMVHAVCRYKMNRKDSYNSAAWGSMQTNMGLVYMFIQQEGVKYSRNFIYELKNFLQHEN